MASRRVRRWTFTVNNPVFCVDYFKLFEQDGPTKFVFGTEVGSSGTRHLQGYIEYRNPKVFRQMCNITPAHWEPARGSSFQNYRYCIKDGQYQLYGDWDNECGRHRRGNVSGKALEVKSVLRELLSDSPGNAKIRPVYLHHKRSYDELVFEIRESQVRYSRFLELRNAECFEWQRSCIEHVRLQNNRQICWYYDSIGGKGKTFLAHIFHFCYKFDLFNGITNTRDITMMISDDCLGFVIDVTRSDKTQFSYSTLESLKNGFIMTGKYQGIKRYFKPKPVIVFANFEPDRSALSSDRFCLHNIEYASTNEKVPLPTPFSPPSEPPSLEEVEEDKEN